MDKATLTRNMRRLREAFEQGQLALVLGPRLAASAGAPGEREVIEALCRELGLQVDAVPSASWQEALLPFDLGAALGLVAGAYADQRGDEALQRAVVALFVARAARPTAVHAEIAALARGLLDGLVVLGWDGLVAKALAAAGVAFTAVRTAAELDAVEGPWLAELLGSVRDPATLVLTTDQQARAFNRWGEGAAILGRVFETRQVLAVGVEPDHPLLAAATPRALASGRPPICVAFTPSPLAGAAWSQQGWLRVEPARDTPQAASEFVAWLLFQVRGELVAATSGKRRPAATSAVAAAAREAAPVAPAAARGATPAGVQRLDPGEIVKIADVLGKVAGEAGVKVERAAALVGLEGALPDDGWIGLVRAIHAGRVGAIGDGRAAVGALVEKVRQEVPGNSAVRELGERLGR